MTVPGVAGDCDRVLEDLHRTGRHVVLVAGDRPAAEQIYRWSTSSPRLALPGVVRARWAVPGHGFGPGD